MICAVAGLALATGQSLDFPGDDEQDPEEQESSGLLNADLMPDGGILKNVLIPQYDDKLMLSATLRAEEMEIAVAKKTKTVEIKLIDALKVKLEFFNPDRTPRGKIEMATARYDAKKQFLTSDQPVSLVSDDLTAEGSRLVYDLKKTRGFLHGPVTATTTTTDRSTSMNSKPVRQAIAAGSLMMAAATGLPAQEPAVPLADRIAESRLSPEEIQRLDEAAVTRKALVEAEVERESKEFAEATAQSELADATLADFFRAAALTTLLAEPLAAPAAGDVPRPNIPVDPTQTRITSDDGAFFDSPNGLLVFLKNVVVKDPRFTLTGADELKVFFEPKVDPEAAAKGKAGDADGKAAEPAKPDTAPAGEKPKLEKVDDAGLNAAKFGKPVEIIATGTVVVEYLPEKKDEPPVKASARTVIYNLKTEQFTLRGGSPWVLREGQLSSVPGNDAYIVIKKDGSFVTGNGGIDARMDIKEKDEDKKNR
jgi:lipopolysaccharide export system protein LptA